MQIFLVHQEQYKQWMSCYPQNTGASIEL